MIEEEPLLFPTSEAERRALQERLVEALATLTEEEARTKLARSAAAAKVAEARKQVTDIARLLRQTRPPQTHRDDG